MKLFRQILSAILLSALVPCANAGEEDKNVTNALPRARAEKFIENASGYICRNYNADGRMNYIRHPDKEEEEDKKDLYNMLRHAGAIYSLWMSQEHKPSAEKVEAIHKTVRYLQNFTGTLDAAANIRCVWSERSERRDPEQIAGKRQSKLGGAGLALIAMTGAQKFLPKGEIPLEEMQGLANFIIYMQKTDGSFYSKYLEGRGKSEKFTSLYYPGEAMLGLLLLYDIAPDKKLLDSAARGLAYLATSRAEDGYYPPDHWSLIASSRMLKRWHLLEKEPVTKNMIAEHAKKVCSVLMSGQVFNCRDKKIIGTFTYDARTCPASTRLEGLGAILPHMQKYDSKFATDMRKSISYGICFLERNMIDEGDLRGGLPRAARIMPAIPRYRSSNRRAPEVRIDYVQHALSAMITYCNLLDNGHMSASK